jgi:hypothetical protein
MTHRKVSDINILPRFVLTLHNAYFQDDDFSNFTGIHMNEGELHKSLIADRGRYAYLPATSMLTIIEVLGSIIDGKAGTKNSFTAFVSQFMPEYDEYIEILYLLRNSLIHEWEGGIAVDFDLHEPVINHMVWDENRLTINLVSFYRDLRAGFLAFKLKTETDGLFAAQATSRLKAKMSLSELKVPKAK